MRILAVYDSTGRILAAAEIDADYAGPVPVAGDGHETGEFDVPESARDLDFAAVCTRMRVNPEQRRLFDPREAGF